MFRKLGFASFPVGILAFLFTVNSASAQVESGLYARALITQNIDEGKRVTLEGNTRHEAKAENDRGAVADDFPMEHMQLQLRRSPEQEQALQQFIEELHTPGSPNFHRWITAQEFGERFGLAQPDLYTITGWLEAQGFQVNVVYPSGMVIDFSGTAGQVRKAFLTEIHHLEVKGEKHIANMSDPAIPAALAPAVLGVVSLHDFRPHAMHKMSRAHPEYTFAGPTYALVPADLATIYNLNPLFSGGYSGQGQTISLIEDTNLFSASDWSTFRSTFGLSSYTSGSLNTVHPAPPSGTNNCRNPGVFAPNDAEAILDAEWASAAAPSAVIEMASCADTSTTFGGLIAIQNLINTSSQPPAIMSISYGQCETVNGASANAAYSAAYQQAVSEGVSIFVASGDSGAATCDNSATAATDGIGVNAFASTAYNVAVGGTDFSDTYSKTNGTYWSSSNTSSFGSALSYIPEIPWNSSCASALVATFEGYSTTHGASGFCSSFLGSFYQTTDAGGGGPSGCATGAPSPSNSKIVSGTCQGWPKPIWQSVLNNPNDGVRDTPDISLFAANGFWGHFYVFCWSDTTHGGAACTGAPSAWSGAGGTSFAAPIMAGIQALVNQKAGGRQGNPNPVYYELAAAEYGSSGSSSCDSSTNRGPAGSCIFYDITQGDMDVPCTGSANCFLDSSSPGVLSTSNNSYNPAYGTTTGWDFATGIGSVNATNLVNNWPPSTPNFRLSASPSRLNILQGSNGSSTITVIPLNGFTGSVSLSASGLPNGVTASFIPTSTTTTSTLTLSSSSAAATGIFTITISGTSANLSNAATVSLAVTTSAATISGTITNGGGATVTLGGAASAITTADATGNYSFSGLASGNYTVSATKTGYTVIPSSQGVTVNGFNVTGVNFTAGIVIAQSGWSLKYVDSQDTGNCGNYAAILSFDGNPSTFWHTAWSAPGSCALLSTPPGPPHEMQINLGTSYNLVGFQYLPRQDGSDNGKIKQYEFYVSSDGVNWALVASGVLMSTPGDKSQKAVAFSPTQGQYVRLREITEINGNAWASMAELNVLASNLGVPDFSVSAGPSALTLADGGSGSSTITTTVVGGFNNAIALSASGQPAGVSVSFNPSSLAAPGSGTSSMSFSVSSSVALGTYPITVTATGGSISHTTTVTLTVTAAGTAIAQSGWTLKYVDSQDTGNCGNYAAILSFDGNPSTFWHTAWSAPGSCALLSTPPGPPHEMQINLGTSYNLVGFQYLPRQDGSDNGKIKQYEFYVSSDGVNWALVASGVLMSTPGDKSQKAVAFSPTQGQYVRLREITEINGNAWASMAELNVLSQ